MVCSIEHEGHQSSRKEISFMTSEPLVQIQNNFTELFLMMLSTKIAQTGFILGRGIPPFFLRSPIILRGMGDNFV